MVKVKPRFKTIFYSSGAVDLHCHGAFGIDLMNATHQKLNDLSQMLWNTGGVAAFCPTTLSSSPQETKRAVQNLGAWIRSVNDSGGHTGAIPLGIHLEGPFISSKACGAHPLGVIRPLSISELDDLWLLSKQTLKIITIAPETLDDDTHKKLISWAKPKKICLNIGHTQCTHKQAQKAFDLGWSGVTHAWNAMLTHHRESGVLGAALGRKGIFVELIPDLFHVSATHIDWTLKLHPRGVVFVSDSTPAAGLPPYQKCSFGDLTIHNVIQDSKLASQIAEGPNTGTLAGGGLLLPQMLAQWSGHSVKTLKKHWASASLTPLKALKMSPQLLKKYKIAWSQTSTNELYPKPVKR